MNKTDNLIQLLEERIVIIDGAMGTMIQEYQLTEDQYRGERFKDFPHSLKGNNDLLVLTQPQIIEDIHLKFLEAGADIIETNTFNANRVSMADYHMEHLVNELNEAAVKCVKNAIERYHLQNSGDAKFIAGSLGPTNKTASLSPDVNNPGYRGISFDELVEIYTEQTEALIAAGVDILLVETAFDTLNAKAALFAINTIKDAKNLNIPVMASGTITDNSGRTLTGQTTEAFWNSVSHADLLSVGLNCALGADQMRPYVEELSRVAWIYTSCYPNAGLPNEFGGYDDSPEHMASVLEEWCKNGWVNIVGGCCGTRPEHIAEIAKVAKKYTPRKVPVLV